MLVSEFYQNYINFFIQLFDHHVDWRSVLLLALTPIFLLGLAVEYWWMYRHKKNASFELKFLLTNGNLQASSQMVEFLMHGLFIFVAMEWFYEHRFFQFNMNGYALIPAFIVIEFCYYWFHRSSHRIRWFWLAHNVHHSGTMMNLSTAARQSFLYPIVGYWIFFIPALLLGMTPTQVLIMYAVSLAYQFFVHTEAIQKLPPWFEYAFNTPSHHRVHHGVNRDYMDKNYGGTLIIFDRLFGTFKEEDEKVIYGIDPPLPEQTKNNIITINFHEAKALIKDMRQEESLWMRFKLIWMPPEWKRSKMNKRI